MRVRCPSPCLLNHSNTSLSTRRWTDVFPGGMTTRARFQKSSPTGAASGESARVLLAPRESFLLTALSEYLTVVFFCVTPVCPPCADDADYVFAAPGVDDAQHRLTRQPKRDPSQLSVIRTIVNGFHPGIFEDQCGVHEIDAVIPDVGRVLFFRPIQSSTQP